MSATIGTPRINDAQFESVISRLGQFVSIPSVSNPASPYFSRVNLQAAADFASDQLRALDFAVDQIVIGDCDPYIIAYTIDEIVDAPTIVLYGHYDVQPVDDDKWTSKKPFVLEERDGRLYGRGSADDKGGIMAIIAAIETYKQEKGNLPINVKIFLEGEEEYGSSHMKALVHQEAKKLNAQALIIMDGSNKDPETGSVDNFARGILNIKLEIEALKAPFHNGLGVLGPDAAMALINVTSSLYPPRNIPGFMEGHIPTSAGEEAILSQSSSTNEEYSQNIQVSEPGYHLRGDPNQSVFSRIINEPNLSVINFNSGIPGGGNSIQAKAECEISIRTLYGQDPMKVQDAVIAHIKAQEVPQNLTVKITPDDCPASAWKGDVTRFFAQKYLESLSEVFPKGSSVLPCGGTLPILDLLETAFEGKLEVICVAVADEKSSRIHSHDESLGKQTFRNAIDSLMLFMDKVARDYKPV